jgi:hypothetical protein
LQQEGKQFETHTLDVSMIAKHVMELVLIIVQHESAAVHKIFML